VRDFSALALWMYSINTRLFLKTLPLDFWYREWYLHLVVRRPDKIKETNEGERAQVLVDLSAFTVFPQQTAENPLPSHPLNLGRHPSLRGTLPLTHTCMPSFPLGSEKITSTSPRVDDGGLDNNSPIFDELLDMRTRICVSDFWLFVGVEPDLALADGGDGGGEPLLRTEVYHGLEGLGDLWC